VNGNEKLALDFEVIVPDATEEELDSNTHQLLSELKELNVESADLAKGESALSGSKGDPITIGTIALEVLPVALPGVIAFVQAWVMSGQARTVKFKGNGIEFEGSPEELQNLLATLQQGKSRK